MVQNKTRSLNFHSQLRICPYSVRMRENADQNNSKYGHLRSGSNSIPLKHQKTFGSVLVGVKWKHCPEMGQRQK